ncbi:competence/damage-inducible protein A [Pallidibacillus pasinlerensis]|uniref:Putative competence-damage inducible protein n=1 Tax=Pallidibacillus pasinlerensis TaxID=2703818 RepID=A0ABW9ZZ64_9BACI|nr:competence/damage-inducible protein A [Pallidibacillus pasinlerensis]NCU16460.1 competence/damage-inducible protein A [Pallidibacillus pasinlerensis]
MKNGEIIAVGSEILLGQITNTNAKFISEHLAKIGINVYYHTVVGDNPNRLLNAVKVAETRADLIIFTGGLGPTKDDLTKETLANHLGVNLEYDEKALRSIENFFAKRNQPMTENNKKQALIFSGSQCLPNDTGMAPGMFLTKNNRTYILLPGPPSEMQPMFTTYAIPEILKGIENVEQIESRVLRFYGIGESKLEVELEDLIDTQTNPTIAPLAVDGEVTVRITAKHALDDERKHLLDETEEKILVRVGKYLYGYNETTIVNEMGKLLQQKNLTLAVAESLTGGLFQEEVTSIAGCSKWFKGGIVSYAPEVKINNLGVKKETIENHGVVSEECAKEMAENVRKLMDTDFGLSFTGVAGPGSLEGKEPGTVYIGVSVKNKPTKGYYVNLFGNRESVRVRSVKHGAWLVYNALREID